MFSLQMSAKFCLYVLQYTQKHFLSQTRLGPVFYTIIVRNLVAVLLIHLSGDNVDIFSCVRFSDVCEIRTLPVDGVSLLKISEAPFASCLMAGPSNFLLVFQLLITITRTIKIIAFIVVCCIF